MDKELISRDTSICLKGLLAIMILVHHIYQCVLSEVEYSIVDYTLRSFGYWGVTTFFLLSGYGLMCSVIREGYLFKLKNKCINMYFLTIFLIVLYWGINSILGINVDINRVIQSFLFGDTIIVAGWYLQETIIFYIGFFLLCKIDKNHLCRNYTLFIIVFIIIMYLIKQPIHWYISCLGLPCGMYVYKYRTKLYFLFNNKYMFSVALSLTLFLISTLWIYISPEFGLASKATKLLFQLFQGVLFALFIISLIQKVNIKNKIT